MKTSHSLVISAPDMPWPLPERGDTRIQALGPFHSANCSLWREEGVLKPGGNSISTIFVATLAQPCESMRSEHAENGPTSVPLCDATKREPGAMESASATVR